MPKRAVIIGSGFAGLSCACFLAKDGWDVTVLEKNGQPGGRAGQFSSAGFTFDKGPSWYWMPDIFERFFAQFGHKASDYYTLERLDPSYRIYWENGPCDIPADYGSLRALFESIEKGSGARLDSYLEEAAFKYDVGMRHLVWKPGRSGREFMDMNLLKGMLRLDVFTSMKSHVAKYFTHPHLRQIMEFPVLFLGATAEKIPALYSLMNYADIRLGTWYPQGGMYAVVDGIYRLALSLGVQFHFDAEVTCIKVDKGVARCVETRKDIYEADYVVGGADYHHVEQELLEPSYRTYSKQYWDARILAPSCLLYYLGLSKKLEGIRHHSLFFDVPFRPHTEAIYTQPDWPRAPLFYMSAPSVTDASVAPEGCENLFLLIPVAPGLTGDDEALREGYLNDLLERIERHTGQSICHSVLFKRDYGVSNFREDYHALKGNAYGLANTLRQTALGKPSIRSKRISNLFYTGQLTVPGPGVPPSLISGEVVAHEILKER